MYEWPDSHEDDTINELNSDLHSLLLKMSFKRLTIFNS